MYPCFEDYHIKLNLQILHSQINDTITISTVHTVITSIDEQMKLRPWLYVMQQWQAAVADGQNSIHVRTAQRCK